MQLSAAACAGEDGAAPARVGRGGAESSSSTTTRRGWTTLNSLTSGSPPSEYEGSFRRCLMASENRGRLVSSERRTALEGLPMSQTGTSTLLRHREAVLCSTFLSSRHGAEGASLGVNEFPVSAFSTVAESALHIPPSRLRWFGRTSAVICLRGVASAVGREFARRRGVYLATTAEKARIAKDKVNRKRADGRLGAPP